MLLALEIILSLGCEELVIEMDASLALRLGLFKVQFTSVS